MSTAIDLTRCGQLTATDFKYKPSEGEFNEAIHWRELVAFVSATLPGVKVAIRFRKGSGKPNIDAEHRSGSTGVSRAAGRRLEFHASWWSSYLVSGSRKQEHIQIEFQRE
jgi:hypothetical protein